jgi:hypothetical protein
MIISGIFSALTEDKGFGVFTKKKIEAGTIIEISPVIVMSAKEKVDLEKTKLYDYLFNWKGKIRNCGKRTRNSKTNRRKNPNARPEKRRNSGAPFLSHF